MRNNQEQGKERFGDDDILSADPTTAQVSKQGFTCNGQFLAPTTSDPVTHIEQACDCIGSGIVSDGQTWPQEPAERGCAAIAAPSRCIPVGAQAP